MAEDDQIGALSRLDEQLRSVLTLSALALRSARGTALEGLFKRQFEATLARIARLHAAKSHDNVDVKELVVFAIEHEALLAQECVEERQYLATAGDPEAGAMAAAVARHRQRARVLAGLAGDLGLHVHSRGIPHVRRYRGVYIAPLSDTVRDLLVTGQEGFLPWADGVIAAVPDSDLEIYRSHSDELAVLFRDANDLLEARRTLDAEGFDRELDRRLDAARSAGKRLVGDALADHVNRLLLRQDTALCNIRERLAPGRPAAAAVVQPLIDEGRDLLAASLAAHATWAPGLDPAGATPAARLARAEQTMQQHASGWAERWRDKDPAGLLPRFQKFLEAGSLAPDLERVAAQVEPRP